MKSFLQQTFTIAAKDLRAELRTKEALNASLAFSVVILVLFSFAIDPSSLIPDPIHPLDNPLKELSGGLLWLVYAFAGALILNRSFARELQNDCLDALIAAPLPPGALFLGKALANFALLMAIELVSLLAYALFFHLHPFLMFWPLLGVIMLGTWGMTVIGTIFSALTVNLQLREMMLPTLIYPLLIPCLMSAIVLTTDMLGGAVPHEDQLWVRLLVAFDFIFTATAVTMIDTVVLG